MAPRGQLLAVAKQSIDEFLSSSTGFRVVHSVSPNQPSAASGRPRTLFILDSSFNPPSIAHLSLVTSALRAAASAQKQRYPGPHRLLLLFSVHNADKSPAPATFEQRLAMMMLFAEDIVTRMQAARNKLPEADIDVGLTTKPYYNDKSTAIEMDGVYEGTPEHVHLVGYDTFVRIFEPKYYAMHSPPLSALASYFNRHGLRVTLRPEEKWGGNEEQAKFWEKLRDGDMEGDGGKSEWADKIEVVESDAEGVGVSSTQVREAAEHAQWDKVRRMCTESVGPWVHEMKPYEADVTAF
ncbi:hypothetical protein FH972_026037 [Carpinus fangiana]|uniref:Nicotinamide-nucleotide adenylyltransferase n=1 Tax=Carpinus fangiana TaxID=176857 RepID=A0A5N6L5D6_9ROSI|nr:hypothetical protein FH972_026037 [Carpinus fangiana]